MSENPTKLPLLSFYLMQAFQSWAAAYGALPYFLNQTIGKEQDFKTWPERLRQLKSSDKDIFFQHVQTEITHRWQRLSQGILNYLSHTPSANRLSAECVWQQGTTKVWNYAPEFPDYPIILLIPSLINKFYIFDLDQDYSFIQYLKDQKLCPWVIDWQEPGITEAKFSLDHYVQQRLIPILSTAYQHRQRKVSLLGYCMGGILSLALSHSVANSSDCIEHLILIATPWDFTQTLFTSYVKSSSFLKPYNSHLFFNETPPIPKEMVQLFFHLYSGEKMIQKFDTFAAIDSVTVETKRLFQIEEWLNDGIALSAPLAFNCFQEWCQDNQLKKGQMMLAGKLFNLKNITVPVLIINGEKDCIVPPESSLPLKNTLQNCQYQSFPLGHIGLIVSKKAPELSWKFISDWIHS